MFLPLLFKHPLTKKSPLRAVSKYVGWQLRKITNSDKTVHTLVGKTRINLSKNDSAALVNYYTGLYEFEEMCFLLHFLRSEDLLLDVGANIGVFSLLASGQTNCKSIAFEPIPSTFQRLIANVNLNGLPERITALNIGLASSDGELNFTSTYENSINRVAAPNDKDTIKVDVRRLDNVLPLLDAHAAILLKIDVEGFETEVLKGAGDLLVNKKLKAIIIELNGSGEKFGFDESRIKEALQSAGFSLYYYAPFTRSLSTIPPKNNWGNAIYLRDAEFINQRLKSASPITVLDHVI